MPKREAHLNIPEETFGTRLARLRREAGFSQRDLQAETDIPQRVIAYYEKQTKHIPAHLLPRLSKALGVTVDQLMGLDKLKAAPKTRDNRLWRRVSQLEKLPAKERKQIVQLLDTFLDREKLKEGQIKQAG
ncbi:helix-turn-helix transcriptional regulator [candidate division TA06 bacterium]|nr:helix-turn-helix transcriptional regulator [candidate division TA06 bacterium]